MKALIINCTLKKSPEESNTEALIEMVVERYKSKGVKVETLRAVDYKISYGIVMDAGKGDEWPKIYKKILECDIFIIASPIWMGHRASPVQLIIERLDASLGEHTDKGQYPLYNKVGGVIVTGDQDGAQFLAQGILYNLHQLGCTIPPNSEAYWVGEAGYGDSFIKAKGAKNIYTKQLISYMVENSVFMADLLQKNPLPTNLEKLDKEAKK